MGGQEPNQALGMEEGDKMKPRSAWPSHVLRVKSE